MKWADSPAAAAWIELLESEPWDRGEASRREVTFVAPEVPDTATRFPDHRDPEESEYVDPAA